MKHLFLFEGFTSDMIGDQKSYAKKVEKKYEDNLREYLHEMTDKFTPREFSFTHNKFSILFDIYPKNIDEFFDVFHNGIFDRIAEDYPGTNMLFDVTIYRGENRTECSGTHFRGPGTYQGQGCYLLCDALGIEAAYKYLKFSAKYKSFSIKIHIY